MKQFFFLLCLIPFFSVQLFSQKAIDSLENLIKKDFVEDTLYIQRLNELAYNIHRVDLNKMWQYAHEADSLSVILSYTEGKAKSIAMKALYYRNSFEVDSGFYYNNTALDLYRKLNDSLQMATIHSEIAALYCLQQNFDMAITYGDSAQVIFEQENEKKQLASVYIDLGVYYNKVGHFVKAMEYYQKAQFIYETIHDPVREALLLTKMSGVNKTYRKYDKTYELIYKSIDKYKSIDDKRGLVDSYYYLAVIFSSTRSNDSAIYWWDKALDIAREINYTHSIIDIQNQAGIIYYSHKKNKAKALSYLQNAYTESKKYKYKNGINISTHFLAKLHWLDGDLEKAKVYAHESHSYAMQIKKLKNISNSYYILSEIYSKAGEYRKAYDYSKLYKIYYDSVFNDATKNKLIDLENKYKYEQEKRELELEQQRKDTENKAQLEKEKRNRQLISLIALLIVLITLGLTFIYRIRQKQKRTELARTKAEVENRLLRVQMNPHFMFNSLNSVQSYIASNQNQLAEDYLARFAQLTRAILNNSREDFISLDNEIETLKTYLELEQQRFNHIFEFDLTIDEDLDEEVLRIPPMLIQPFVENAIIHGVAPLKQNGIIKLDFQLLEKEKSIQCIITDNGIGRNESAKINKGSKHKSLGLQVTQERFMLIKQQTNVPVKVDIIDMEQGTKVELKIPFLEK